MALPSTILKRGDRASQPAATSVAVGVTYYVTDELLTEQSNGTIWEPYSAAGAGTGDVSGPGSSVDKEMALFDGTGGVLLERATGTGIVRVTSGVYGTPGNVVESEITLADNTTNDVSTTKHGLAPKAPNDATQYLDGTGAYSVPAGSGSGSISQGAYASLPGTCAVGDLYIFTDTVYNFAQCATTDVWTIFQDGKIIVPPGPKASWTNVNAGSDLTVTDAAGSIQLAIVVGGGTQWRGISIAQPSTPYVKVFRAKATSAGTNACIWGTYFYDGTKLMGIEFVPSTGITIRRILRWTNVTTPSTALYTLNSAVAGSFYDNGGWTRLSNDGADLTWDFSIDGITWIELGTEAVGTTLTPTHLAVGGLVGEASATNYLSFQGYT